MERKGKNQACQEGYENVCRHRATRDPILALLFLLKSLFRLIIQQIFLQRHQPSVAQLEERGTVIDKDTYLYHPEVTGSIPVGGIFCTFSVNQSRSALIIY